MILGIFYFALAFGILLGWLTYAIIIVFEPISDVFMFKFVNFMGWISEESVLRMQDPTLAIFPYEIILKINRRKEVIENIKRFKKVGHYL
ncbi:hypothetical protein LCGC14_0729210 [marine sediment metagenome]|uniref:Uncharacterized protein n=1 Tax=marine sediment metagenome TaxID=412755 RepID=A0A0F9QEB2_9ZZZZ|nr:MAG: hypothetical protein Lokiarch_50650 [Candidatus Lokiarchaeum sp. GC14_75]